MASPTFLEYFNNTVHPIKLIDKKQSSFMRFLGWCLSVTNALRLSDIEDFLGAWCTTISNKIYDHPGWPWAKLASPLVVHELCHVLLWGFWYAVTYVLSKKKRLLYESTCIQAEMLCFPHTRTEESINRDVSRLKGYGIPEKLSRTALTQRLVEVLEGRPQPAARQVWRAYDSWTREINRGGSAGQADPSM